MWCYVHACSHTCPVQASRCGIVGTPAPHVPYSSTTAWQCEHKASHTFPIPMVPHGDTGCVSHVCHIPVLSHGGMCPPCSHTLFPKCSCGCVDMLIHMYALSRGHHVVVWAHLFTHTPCLSAVPCWHGYTCSQCATSCGSQGKPFQTGAIF